MSEPRYKVRRFSTTDTAEAWLNAPEQEEYDIHDVTINDIFALVVMERKSKGDNNATRA